MNSKDLIVGIVVASIALAGGPARADLYTYDFEDTIDFTNPANPYWADGDSPGNGKLIVEDAIFAYEHNINHLVDFDAGHLITEASLSLEFHDDDPADRIRLTTGLNEEEWVRFAFDGDDWEDITGEVDNGLYSLIVDIGWLNDDGILEIEVDVWNDEATGDVYLRSSTLAGLAVVPLPAAVLLGMLGLGVAGWKLRKHV